MSDEITVDGVNYVSSKRAAVISGYAQDYIGQLCRSQAIDARRMGGLWYLSLDSLYKHKQKADSYIPVAPRREPRAEAESLISFDGKDYISTSRAAEITGYHKDYVGQLARDSVVLSKQVGQRWYVEKDSLLEHKRVKDAMLAKVQTEAVGLQRPPTSIQAVHTETLSKPSDSGPLPVMTYVKDERDLLPILTVKKPPQDEVHAIPIRTEIDQGTPRNDLVEPRKVQTPHFRVMPSHVPGGPRLRRQRSSPLPVAIAGLATTAATIVIVIAVGGLNLGQPDMYAAVGNLESVKASVGSIVDGTAAALEQFFVPELLYERKIGN